MSKPENEIKSVLKFSNYVVDEVHFVTNKSYNNEGSLPIEFDIQRDINFDNQNNSAEVSLHVLVFENAVENNFPFSFSVTVTGSFQVENVETDLERQLIEKNAIAILFPYIRALISTYTANANVSPLILPPINVVRFLERKEQNEVQ